MATYKLKYSGEKIDTLLGKMDALGTGDGSQSGTVKLSSATNSTSGTSDGVAATPAAVKSAYDKATSAETKADSASTAAQNAQSTANSANTAASNAQTTANEAKTAAATAQTTANDATSKANSAQTKADTVESSVQDLSGQVTDIDARVGTVEKQVANINLDNVDLRNIALDVESGTASAKYPVGTKLVIPWDRVTSAGDKANYNPEWNIMHYESDVAYKDSAEDENDKTGNAMYLEWDKTIPDGFAFCIQQALQCFDGTEGTPNGLPAGTYCFKMKAPNGGATFRSYWNGKYAKFVLTDAIPAGGTLRMTINTWDGTDTTKFGLIMRTYGGYAQSDGLINSYTASAPQDTQPSDATYLGEVWGDDVGYGKLNDPEACYYGSNVWAYSDLRQWLNGDGTDWWEKLTRYNIKPTVASSLQGFLTGLDDKLKSMLKFVKVVTVGNNVQYQNQQFVTYDKIFLHSFNQSNITTDYGSQFDNEGKRWDYYKQLAQGVSNLDSLGRFKIWNTYPVLIRYAINAPTSAQHVFSRSAYLGNARNVYSVNPSGYCGSTHAGNGSRCLPACVIMGANE